MERSNFERLRKTLLDKEVMDVILHDSHGMVLEIIVRDAVNGYDTVSICTYDDAFSHASDEFYVSLNGEEL